MASITLYYFLLHSITISEPGNICKYLPSFYANAQNICVLGVMLHVYKMDVPLLFCRNLLIFLVILVILFENTMDIMKSLQCIQNTLARIVTNCNKYTRASPILKRLPWLPVEFCCILKTATLVYKFLHNGHPCYFGPLSSTHCGRYSTRYNHPDKRFLNSVHLYINPKITLATALLLMLPRFGIICLMRSVLPQLSPVSGKG